MKKIISKQYLVAVLLMVLMMSIQACKEESLVSSTSDASNITTYLAKYPERFSEFSKILERSETASFLDAYGTYTMFAPTNEAIKSYLSKTGKNSIDAFSKEELTDLVRFHLLDKVVKTTSFSDGKLSSLTMYGQYLVTGATNNNGVTSFRINRQANLEEGNLLVGNGVIHIIGDVLTPASLTLAQTIEANGRYSIFTQALKETGLYDSLNILPALNPDTTRGWLSVIAESDSVLLKAGIPDYEALKGRLSNTKNPKLASDSLHLWVDYHILYQAKYLADIITLADAHSTLAPQEVLTSKLAGQTVLINDDEFNGTYEPGFSLMRAHSDITATNGVVHEASSHFTIKLRSPYGVYYDVAAMPDIQKMSSVYRKETYTFTPEEAGALADVRFEKPELLKNANALIYRFGSGTSTSKTSANMDVLICPFGVTSRSAWVEFRPPLVIKGKYKVWISYYAQSQSSSPVEAQVTIGLDGTTERVPLSNARTLHFNTKRPGINKTVNGVSVIDTVAEEAIGWKSYTAVTSGAQVARLVGVADIKQTGRYWIRLTAISGSQNTNNVDMIHLIPINMNQQYPRFNPDGSRIEAR